MTRQSDRGAEIAGAGPRLVVRLRHPVVVVALVGVAYVIVQVWWIARERHVGALNVDEAGGVFAALRFERAASDGVGPLIRMVGSTRSGPLVPLLSLPFLGVHRGTVAAMAVQPILMSVAGIAIAAIVDRCGRRPAAILAGVVTMALPVSVVASRSYLYGTGVAATLAVAVWALLTSDRGTARGRMIVFGAAVGLMLLARPMSLAFLPGIAVAVAIVVRGRRGRAVAALAATVAVAVALPWWAAQRKGISGYLSSYGYGERAGFYGPTAFGGRVAGRLSDVASDWRMFLLPAALVVVGALLALRSRGGVGPSLRDALRRPWSDTTAGRAAVAAIVVTGFVVLCTTSNQGVWFALPLDVLAVALLGMCVPAATTGPGERRLQRVTSAAVVVLVVVSFVVSFGVPSSDGLDPGDLRQAVVGEHVLLQGGNLDADPRLRSDDASVRRAAADDWRRAADAVAGEVGRRVAADGVRRQLVAGEIHLFDSNTIGLTEELTGQGIVDLEVVNTFEPTDLDLRATLRGAAADGDVVLLLVAGRSAPLLDGRDADRVATLARADGWRVAWRHPLPDGGAVALWEPPS